MKIKDKKNKEDRIDQQEWLVLQVALHIEKLMEQQSISRTELAKRLGTSKGYVTQLLDGANMTLRKLADVMMALDSSLKIDTTSLGFETTLIPEERGYIVDTNNDAISWGKSLYYNSSCNEVLSSKVLEKSGCRLAS